MRRIVIHNFFTKIKVEYVIMVILYILMLVSISIFYWDTSKINHSVQFIAIVKAHVMVFLH